MIGSQGYRKGQYFSFDAIVATVIFVLTLVMLLSYWHSVRTYLDYQTHDLTQDASRISDMVFAPPSGDCDKGTLSQFGLASSWGDQRINQSLLQCEVATLNTPDKVKAALGSGYNVSIVIQDKTGTYSPIILGDDPTAPSFSDNKTEVAKITRIATMIAPSGENHLATLDVYVYR